ncbi:MAG: PD-(D/E)XK nuclease family protein [Chloroflexia bacterium]|nr:PD-(D/E)XK nuclease family protein [Chloroflexia bacterium]
MANQPRPDCEFPPAGPSWPMDGWISPTALKTFNRCPHRVRLRYLEKVPEPKSFIVHLSKGRITHDLLAMSAKRIVLSLGDLDDDWFFQNACRRLPHWEFPTDEARASHARNIADWVGWVLRYLDRTATYLRIEKGEHRELPWGPAGARLTLATRPDLVLLRTDDAGEPFIDFIDYKTGQQQADDLVPVFMRYALTTYLRTVVPDTQSISMRFTWLWLESGDAEVTNLSLESSLVAWAGLRDNVDRLMAERKWAAQPSYGCHYCPYNGVACHAFASMDTSPDGR